MSAIREIFKTYGPEYLARFGSCMPSSHKKVMRAILKCRSGDFGSALYRCESCGRMHLIPASCGNRHCPTCQHHKADDWLAGQLRKLLPCGYFLLTFTVPEPLRAVMRSHQRVTYDALFSSSSLSHYVSACAGGESISPGYAVPVCLPRDFPSIFAALICL